MVLQKSNRNGRSRAPTMAIIVALFHSLRIRNPIIGVRLAYLIQTSLVQLKNASQTMFNGKSVTFLTTNHGKGGPFYVRLKALPWVAHTTHPWHALSVINVSISKRKGGLTRMRD